MQKPKQPKQPEKERTLEEDLALRFVWRAGDLTPIRDDELSDEEREFFKTLNQRPEN